MTHKVTNPQQIWW